MCGIAGIISTDLEIIQSDMINRMTNSLNHRGPDGEGIFRDLDNKIALGHRRLSIIDLSNLGAQPMHYLNGRYSITFNGEIYNYLELRADLIKNGYIFKSNSDTEVLLALYDFKKEACLEDLDGMFAFAIVDNVEKNVFCARDRFGEKPFFYHHIPGKLFVFASEMKAIWSTGVSKDTNLKMLFNFLAFGNVENASNKSETFYSGILRLENSFFLKIDLNKLSIAKKQYWTLKKINRNTTISFEEASENFRNLMIDSVNKRLRSDVSTGSSLSGGLDSSLIVSIISKLNIQNQQSQKTFSAVFPGFKLDELEYIKSVVKQSNAEAYFTSPNSQLLIDKFDEISYYQEEPFRSASICVQYDVMNLAKINNTPVLLDGQGADELLGGYHYYFKSFFREMNNHSSKLFYKQYGSYKDLHKKNDINQKISFNPILDNLVSNKKIFKVLFASKFLFNSLRNPLLSNAFLNEYFSYNELEKNIYLYHSNDLNKSLEYSMMDKGLSELLRYSDRNSMANSVEVRLPFLSHKLVEFVFSIPSEYKISNGWTKYILRKSFDDILPKEIAWRKDKIGYEPPQNDWINNKFLKEKIVNTVERLDANGILNKQMVYKYKNNFTLNNEIEWRLLSSSCLF